MRWIKVICMAVSTYTRIPAPRVEWGDDARKLSIAFLPLAGAAVGMAVWLWQLICGALDIGAVLFAAVAAAIPLWVTGGIHMDGYCDTTDALASWQGRERGLEILKDPHTGAFAVIRYGAYLLISFALLHELFLRGYGGGLGFMYVLSRSFAALNALTLPNARKDGMLAAFTREADRRLSAAILAVFAMLGAAGWVWFAFPYALAGLLLCLPITRWYRGMAMKRFGGATGDTTGYYLQITESALLAGLLGGGILWRA